MIQVMIFKTGKKSFLKFPCSFPLKVMGLNTKAFSSAVLAILGTHIPVEKLSCERKVSSGDKYLSLTLTFTAESKEQLDAIYRDLNNHHLVLMTL